MREWLLWAFFHAEVHEAREEWREEIDGYLAAVEEYTGQPLEKGTVATSRGMRVTMDTVPMVYRPLIWYGVSGIVVCVECVADVVRLRSSREWTIRRRQGYGTWVSSTTRPRAPSTCSRRASGRPSRSPQPPPPTRTGIDRVASPPPPFPFSSYMALGCVPHSSPTPYLT